MHATLHFDCPTLGLQVLVGSCEWLPIELKRKEKDLTLKLYTLDHHPHQAPGNSHDLYLYLYNLHSLMVHTEELVRH